MSDLPAIEVLFDPAMLKFTTVGIRQMEVAACPGIGLGGLLLQRRA